MQNFFYYKNPVILLVSIFLFLPLFATDVSAKTVQTTFGQVWQVTTRRWDTAQEQRFAQWVEKTVTEDFLLRHRIAVDCADVPYAIRWIYARIAHLPAAATTVDNRLLGHWSTDWKHLPTDELWYRDTRFLASLAAVLSNTSTRTLPQDTYPIRIDPQVLTAGSVFIGDGHAGIIGRIVTDGSKYSPIQTWESSLPRKITKLRQKSYFAAWVSAETGTGLVRFRWPVLYGGRWKYLEKDAHPYHSLEQYSPDFYNAGESFDLAVARRIDPKHYDPVQKAHLIINSIHRSFMERVKIVRNGFRHCRRKRCPEGSYLWEVYSTPGRDDMITFEIIHLRKLINENEFDESSLFKEMERLIIPIDDERTITLAYAVQNYIWLSHNPDDPLTARWALEKCDMIQSQIKSSLQDIDFVEKRYRITNPDYADRRRRYTLRELGRLNDQGASAGCGNLGPLPGDNVLLSW